MKRTINISDKYKSMIEDYEKKNDKDEINLLITKLLKANYELKSKGIDILVISDLIYNFDIDFFELMGCLSKSRNIENKKIQMDDMENRKEIFLSKKKKTEVKKEENIKKKNNETKIDNETNLDNEIINNDKEIDNKKKESNLIKSNPILDLGIDLR